MPGGSGPDLGAAGANVAQLGRHHADASGTYRLLPHLDVGANGSVFFDHLTQSLRTLGGAEVGVPLSVFDWRFAWLEAFGAPSGRLLTSSVGVGPVLGAHAFVTASYAETPQLFDRLREVGLQFRADASLLSWLSLQADGRVGLPLPALNGIQRASPLGVSLGIRLAGSL